MTALDTLRLERGAAHLCRLGERATAEFLVELARRIGGEPAIYGLLAEYAVVTPGQVRAAGGSGFPRRVRAVPTDEAREARA